MTDTTDAFERSWLDYTSGVHFDRQDIRVEGGSDVERIVQALFLCDRDAGAGAAMLNGMHGFSGDPAFWLQVERAALSPPEPGKSKWETRAAKLGALESDIARDSRIYRIATGRQNVLRAEAMGRVLGEPLGGILDVLKNATAAFSGAKDVYGLSVTDFIRGRAFGWRGQPANAMESLSAALAGFVALGNRFRIADTSYELGVTLRDLGRFEAAERLLRQAISLEAQRNNSSSLARADQALVLTLIARARTLPASEAATVLDEAHTLALSVYKRSATITERRPPETTDAAGEAAPEDYRAAISARDLAEIALLRGNLDLARRWLRQGAEEARLTLDDDQSSSGRNTLYGKYVLPAFDANAEEDRDLARSRAGKVSFEHIRLAEIEQQMYRPNDRAEWGKGLDDIARVWELQSTPHFAIEAWGKAADAAELAVAASASEAPRADVDQAAANARFWRHLAARTARRIGSSRLPSADRFPVVVSENEKKILESAKVTPEQDLVNEPSRRILRVRGPAAEDSQRLTLWTASGDTERWIKRLVHARALSNRKAGIPRVETFGIEGDMIWMLDEEIVGQPLIEAAKTFSGTRANLRALADIADTVQGLLALSVPSVHLDITWMVCLPGERVVLTRYGAMLLDPPGPAGGLYASKGYNAESDARAFLAFATLWLQRKAPFQEAGSRGPQVQEDVWARVRKDTVAELGACVNRHKSDGRAALQSMATALASAAARPV